MLPNELIGSWGQSVSRSLKKAMLSAKNLDYPMSNLPITLRSGNVVLETRTDAAGNFLFSDLEPKIYRIAVDLPRGWLLDNYPIQNRDIDLRTAECAGFSFRLKQQQAGFRGTITARQGNVVGKPSIEAIPIDPTMPSVSAGIGRRV